MQNKMVLSRRQLISAVISFASLIVVSRGRQLQPLVCNSVNDLQEMNAQTDLVYVTTRGKECTFVFQGPPESQLDLRVHSFSTEGTAKNACRDPPVRVFTYNKKSKLRQFAKVLCAEDDAVRIMTDTNTAIVTSSLHYGSFFVRVRPVSALIATQLSDPTPPRITRRGSDFFQRRRADVFRFNGDSAELPDIDGMYPPGLESVDFFGAINQFEIPIRFRAQPQGFTPSLYFPNPGNPRPTDSYGAPVTAGSISWGVYPGSPGPQVSITSSPSPVEWVGKINGSQQLSANQTEASTIGFTGYPEGTTVTSEISITSRRPTEATTASSPTRYTEPLTSPSTSLPLSLSSASSTTEVVTTTEETGATTTTTEGISTTYEAPAAQNNETPTNGTTIVVTNTTSISTEIETIEEGKKRLRAQIAKNSHGFKPMLKH